MIKSTLINRSAKLYSILVKTAGLEIVRSPYKLVPNNGAQDPKVQNINNYLSYLKESILGSMNDYNYIMELINKKDPNLNMISSRLDLLEKSLEQIHEAYENVNDLLNK